MVEKQEILTQEGYNKLEEEVEYLKTVKRKEVAERIKVAISFGDLSENAEYDEAKNEQAQVEERIVKLENMLRKAVIIDESQIDSKHSNSRFVQLKFMTLILKKKLNIL